MQSARTDRIMIAEALALMRPHQWVKNGFVLLGLVFSHRWSDGATMLSVLLAAASFCAMSSMVYIYNDLVDVAADRLHPTKCLRPIASGAVSVAFANTLCGLLLVVSLLLALAVSPVATGLVCAYAVLNFAYSHRLKHVVIVDVFVISLGFMLRILVGTLGVGIAPSSWLLLTGMMLTLFLGFGKRRAELVAFRIDGLTARKVLAQYDLGLLDQMLAVTAGCAVLTYSLYTVSADTLKLHGTDKLIYTVPFIVYGIFRYLFLLHRRQRGQDAARDLLTDKHLLLTVGGWLAATLAILA